MTNPKLISFVQLSLPRVDVFPLFTSIPFTIRVTTTTKSMKYNPTDKISKEEMFPAPPLRPRNVLFTHRRCFEIRAKRYRSVTSEVVGPLGGMGDLTDVRGSSQENDKVKVQNYGRTWIPSETDKEMGSWRQETVMRGNMNFKSTPGFESKTLSVKVRFLVGYLLELSVFTVSLCFPPE